MFFRKKEIPTNTILLIEIEGGSIAVAVVKFSSGKEPTCPHIIFYKRKDLRLANYLADSRDTFSLLFKSLNDCLAEAFAYTKQMGRPDAIHCFIASPLYLSNTTHLRLKQEKLFKVTSGLIKKIVDDHLDNVRTGQHLIHPGLANQETSLIESKIMKLRANGYQLNHVSNQEANELQIDHFSSFSAKGIFDRIKNTVAGFYPNISTTIHTSAFALYSTLNDNLPAPHSYLVASIGSLTTELIIVREGLICEIGTIPFGEDSALAEIAKTLGRTPDELRSIISLQTSVDTENANFATFSQKADQVREVWIKHLHQGLSALTEHAFLPRQFLIVGHTPISKILSDWLSAENFREVTRSQTTISSRFLAASILSQQCSINNNPQAASDIHLLAEVLFCDRLFKQGQLF